jgi:two-component system, chemotaxis family, response regulator Rcp1
MPTRILLIEDNTGDVRFMREVLLGTNNAIHLLVVSDGAEALTFLKQEGIHMDATRPDLILLDLSLPKIDGREVLAHIKSDASLRNIPIIVLTTSDAEVDIVKSYQLQANCYLSKPGQLNEFELLVKSMSDFWLNKAKLPRQESAVGLQNLVPLDAG